MARYLRAPGWRLAYKATCSFRYGGRNYKRGADISPRRLDMPRWRLDNLYREGTLRLANGAEDRAYRKAERERLASWQPPQPTGTSGRDPRPSQEEQRLRRNAAAREQYAKAKAKKEAAAAEG